MPVKKFIREEESLQGIEEKDEDAMSLAASSVF